MKKSYLITGTADSKALLIEKPDEHLDNVGSYLGLPINNDIAVLTLLPVQENTALLQPTSSSPVYNDTVSKFALSVNNKVFKKVGTLAELTDAVERDKEFSNYLSFSDGSSVDFPTFDAINPQPRAMFKFPSDLTGAMVIGFQNNVSGDTISLTIDIREGNAVALINQNKAVVSWLNANGVWMIDPSHDTVEQDRKPLIFEVVKTDKITIVIKPAIAGNDIKGVISEVVGANGTVDEVNLLAWTVIENQLATLPSPTPSGPISPSLTKNFDISVSGYVYGNVIIKNVNNMLNRQYSFYLKTATETQPDIFSALLQQGFSFFGELNFSRDTDGNNVIAINESNNAFILTFTADTSRVDSDSDLPSNVQVLKTASNQTAYRIFLVSAPLEGPQ